MARGGYRRPSNPAPVSGPGRLSRRTDGGPSQPIREMGGGGYGERKELTELQQGAPMAAAPKPQRMPKPEARRANQGSSEPIVPLTAPTQYPNEPLTAGMPFGAGPGREALAMNQNKAKISTVLSKIVANDPTGEVSSLYNYLISRGM